MKSLKKCVKCGRYTMRETDGEPEGKTEGETNVNCAKAKCVDAKCGGETRAAHPPKYSPVDKYASYRRKEKYG